MDYETIRFEVRRPVARIVLAQAASGNRVGARMLRELQDACQALANDDLVRVVILSAEGPHFCEGWQAETLAEGLDLPPDPFSCLAALPQPVVAIISGRAVSAGLEMALACDVRVCAEGAIFALPETELGLLPRGGGTQRLSRAAGRGIALAMTLAGEELDAQAALRAGLVSRVLPAKELGATGEAIAASIAARGPVATRYAKEAIHRGAGMTLEQALRYETDLTIILQTTDDRAEGVRAFAEKRRTPNFKGK